MDRRFPMQLPHSTVVGCEQASTSTLSLAVVIIPMTNTMEGLFSCPPHTVALLSSTARALQSILECWPHSVAMLSSIIRLLWSIRRCSSSYKMGSSMDEAKRFIGFSGIKKWVITTNFNYAAEGMEWNGIVVNLYKAQYAWMDIQYLPHLHWTPTML
jgi:hypothetical protein